MQIAMRTYINKNSFITLSFCFTIICIALFFIGTHHKVLSSFVLFFLLLNVGLSIWCWLQKRYSPYRTALAVVNTVVFVILSIFYFCTPVSNDIKILFENHLHLNTWDWIAFILAGITLIFAACKWSSQEKTQKNTLQITPEGQYALLTDSVRDAYRNLSLIYALDYKISGLSGQYYPSEELILRMCSDDRFIFPSLFADDYEKCRRLQRFRVNVRNANIELRVIADRFKDRSIKSELHEDDIRLIKDRIDNNIKRLHELLKLLWEYDANKAKALYKYIKENAANCNDDKEEYLKLFAEADEKFDSGELQYFYTGRKRNGKPTEFLNLLFPISNEDDEAEFLRKLNNNIYADAHLYGRIRLIPYSNSMPLILD